MGVEPQDDHRTRRTRVKEAPIAEIPPRTVRGVTACFFSVSLGVRGVIDL